MDKRELLCIENLPIVFIIGTCKMPKTKSINKHTHTYEVELWVIIPHHIKFVIKLIK